MPFMSHYFIWDTAFALGIMLQVTKLADFLLRPKQQEWVRGKCESFTLRLEYFRPLTWFYQIQDHKIQNFFIAQVAVLAMAVDASLASLPLPLMLVYLCILCGPAFLLLYTRGIPIVRWIYGNGHFGIFIWRYFQFLLIGGMLKLLIAAISVCNNKFILPHIDPSNSFYSLMMFPLGLILLALASISLCVWIILVLGLFAIVAQLLLLALSAFVALFRAIAWRVVEYNKGPWAALTLLVTAILGCFDLYLHVTGPIH